MDRLRRRPNGIDRRSRRPEDDGEPPGSMIPVAVAANCSRGAVRGYDGWTVSPNSSRSIMRKPRSLKNLSPAGATPVITPPPARRWRKRPCNSKRRWTSWRCCRSSPREYWHHNTKSHPLADRHGTGGKMAWKDGLGSDTARRRETRLNATPPKFPIPSEPVRLARRVLAATALSLCRR